MTTVTALATLRWESCFDPTTLARGRGYAEAGRVTALTAQDPEGYRWAASVRGRRVKPYRCDAQVRPARDHGNPGLISYCSCPIGGTCKHVAAMLYLAQARTAGTAPVAARAVGATPVAACAPDPLVSWAPWLQRLDSAPATATAAPASAELGLLLRAAAYSLPPQLLVALVSFSRNRQGQLINPQSLQLNLGNPSHSPADGWQPDELLTLGVLLERQVEKIGKVSYAPVRGQLQEKAFETLLQHRPVYFERGTQPLTLGPARQLALHWQDQPDGSQRLACAVAGEHPARLLKAESVWYLDLDAGQLGRIDAGLPLLELARTAPPLLPEHSAALRQRLSSTRSTLPAPALRPPPRSLRAAPVLTLRLDTVQPQAPYWSRRPLKAADPAGVAQLGFDYAGERVTLDGPANERRWRDGELLELHRDRAAEQAWLARLPALDFLAPSQLPYPVNYSYESLSPDRRLLAPGKARQPQPPEAWTGRLQQLADAGVLLDYAGDFPRPLRELAVDSFDAELSASGSHWFDLSLGIDLEGQRVDLLPILRQLLADPKFPLQPAPKEAGNARWRIELDDQRALLLPLAKLRALLAPLLDWLQQDGSLRLHRSQGEALRTVSDVLHWRGGEALRKTLLALDLRPKAAKAPAGFKATLRPYQQHGLAWLNLLGEAGLGGVLADDMGLGKTVQVLAHLLGCRQRGKGDFRALVVAPTSLMGNWQDEAARFAPRLKTLLLHGPERADRFDDIASHDLILTSYPLLARDREHLITHDFSLLVLDEAQAIKNAKSQAAQVVRELRASRRLAMTGTPLENHLGELWAQFDAIEPGLLGSEREFTRIYRTPIEKHGDGDRQQRLNRRIGPLLLRRRKDEVLTDLPAKTEIVRTLELDAGQRELYETLRLAQHQRVRDAVAARGLAQSGIVVLDALLKLRQACCDPRLLKLPAARKVKESAKLDALLELLTTSLDEGRKVLLFSQFTGMLDLIETALDQRQIDFLRLDGDTPGRARAGLVRRFQNGDTPLFLISLKAGGVGLNLTAADTVIHYDPWWNPAVENQATDRAHRIGQDKPVFVYKLICQGTVEEKILALQTRKADLAQAVLEGGRSTQARFTEKDLSELFAPLK